MEKEDFLTDPKFVQWVNNPTTELDFYWKNWMNDNPECLPTLKLAREVLLRIRYREYEVNLDNKKTILNGILLSPEAAQIEDYHQVEKFNQPKNIWSKITQIQRIAAILFISFCWSWLFFPNEETVQEELLAVAVPMVQKSTAPGEKLQFNLPDGTRVWLNSVSTLDYPQDFDSLERVVTLSGEGFFEIEKDSLKPFRVICNGLVTTALGTSFNVNGKPRNKVLVSLLNGRVKLLGESFLEEVYLNPGEELSYESDQGISTINTFNLNEVIAWRDGLLIFRDATLMEVIKGLEDWYGVSVQLENPKGLDWKYSGEYRHQTLENVLNSLSYIQKFQYTINGKNVEFKF